MNIDLAVTELGAAEEEEHKEYSDDNKFEREDKPVYKEQQEHRYQLLIDGIINRCNTQGMSAEEYYEIKKRSVIQKEKFMQKSSELWDNCDRQQLSNFFEMMDSQK